MFETFRRALGRLSPPTSAAKVLPKSSILDAADVERVARIREANLTYLTDSKLASVANTCREIERTGVRGVFIEAGCALGGSSILIASVKRRDRELRVYDVFGMIPAPTAEDTDDVHRRYRTILEGNSTGIGGDKYYGYQENLYETVRENFQKFGYECTENSVSLIKGLLQETMSINEPVAFAHIDVDWYDPVSVCLERVFPRLEIGGSIILDDYFDWGGCRKAADEYLRGVVGRFSLDDSAGSLKIIKIK